MTLCYIHITNSSIILKDDDGTDIKLSLLKRPIPINTLICENEEDFDIGYTKKGLENIIEEISISRQVAINGHHKSVLKFLKDPISLDELDKGMKLSLQSSSQKITSYVKEYPQRMSRERKKWKQNVMTIFEFSHVYPFVHSYGKFKCYICSKPFLDANLLREHTTNDHTYEDLSQELNKKVRDNIKVDVGRLQCKVCNAIFVNLNNLKIHLKDHGKDIDPDYQDNIIPFKLSDEVFNCQICGENFQRLRILIIHMNKHFNNYSCEVCGGVFISINMLKRHLQTHASGIFPCEKCDKVFSNPAKRINHVRGVHLKKFTRTCPYCPERFNSNYQRSKHLRISHNESNRYRCETCDRQYDLKYQLFLHKRSVHMQERNQECDICHSRFFSKYCLARHMIIHTGDKKYKCVVCGQAYPRRKNLLEHMKSHETVQSCSVCSKVFNDPETLTTHMNTVHEDLTRITTKQPPGPKTNVWQMSKSERQNAATFLEYTTVKPFFYQQSNFKCFYCDQIFPEIQSVLHHVNYHVAPERNTLLKQYLKKGKRVVKVDISDLKCKICDQKFSHLDEIRKHLIFAHNKEFNSAGNGLMAYDLHTNDGLLSCHKCNMSFNTFFLLNRHMNVHYNVVCETCGLGFMSYQRLINHRIVHQTGVHKCDKCEGVFPTKLKLRYHMFKKHEEFDTKRTKPLKCPHCLERFSEHYRKMTHLKQVHGITFTFECQDCKEVFSMRRALTEHITKQHKQSIQCKECGKCFGTESLLKMHARGHTGERNFFCGVCKKVYMHERTLRQHMRVHGHVWKQSCTECGRGFQNRNEYNKHVKHSQCQQKHEISNEKI
ncbi:zinc finger protein 493-like [Battus philenor]|uniref:zinc finger protein 493-like n=1 Tax=Battus philenor TaxID=42288 RepID=UPI0035CFDC28